MRSDVVRVTEVSLSFEVARPPRTYVDKSMPYFANALGEDVERVIPKNSENFYRAQRPQWIDKPQPGTVRFVCSVGQHTNRDVMALGSAVLPDIPGCEDFLVECSYLDRSSVMTFHGIKYKHVDQFNAYVSDVLRVLDTEPSGAPVTKYKAVAKFDVCAPWDQDALADIITNDPDIAQVVALCERTSTLGGRRLFSVVIADSDNVLCRAAVTHECGVALAMMSKLPDEDTSLRAAQVLRKLFELYESKVGCGPAEDVADHETTGIESLREKLPELFVNNYTRECPVLPVLLSSHEAERQRKKSKRVILYPSEGTFSRHYTAPDGYFVGLKRNRLSNRNRFPCLVTCYLQDHMLRSGSETHRYYNDVQECVSADAKKRPLPKSIQDPNYRRKRAESFLDALELASGVKLKSFRWLPQLVKQEMWDMSDDDIMAAVTGDTASGSLMFRYFEEAVGVSVHVVVIRDGNFEPLVPRHRGRYVWAPPYPLHVVVFETHRTTYGERSCSYDFLTRGNTTLFDGDDPVVSYIAEHKGAASVPPPDIQSLIGCEREVVEQTLDRNGKCAAITTSDGASVRMYTRPLAVPVTPDPTCFLDSHVRKMNEAKRDMGLPQVDLSKRSNNDVLYFPNDASYNVFCAERAASEGLFQEDGMDGGPSE